MCMVGEVMATEGFLPHGAYLTWVLPNADPAVNIPLCFASWHWVRGTRKHDGRSKSMGGKERPQQSVAVRCGLLGLNLPATLLGRRTHPSPSPVQSCRRSADPSSLVEGCLGWRIGRMGQPSNTQVALPGGKTTS